MNYAEIKSNFSAILNRRDLTPTQTTLFMTFALQRIQRVLRVPAMERLVVIASDGSATLSIPGDLLEVISISTNDATNQEKLVRVDLQTAIRASNIPGIPTVYCRNGPDWLIGNTPALGINFNVAYYADFGLLSADTDTNWLTNLAPDLLIYGALVRASDFFSDERKQAFEDTFLQSLADLHEMAHMDELENASVSPAFRIED